MRPDTLGQIAAQVGASPNTVLRVLRGQNKEIWPSAIRRGEAVRAAARKMGYLPNGSARAMRSGRHNAVSLVLSTDAGRSYLPDGLFAGIHDALSAKGIRLIVSKLPDATLTDAHVMPVVLREWSCDGLLINYTDRVPEKMIRLLANYRIPSVWINRQSPADCVCYDDAGAAQAATRHLLALGHRRIAYLDFSPLSQWPTAHCSRADRYAGYATAMQQAGLTPACRDHVAGVPIAGRLDATVALLRGAGRPTAVLTFDAGLRLLHAAAVAGLRVPQQVSLMTFGPKDLDGNDPLGEEFHGRRLAMMCIPVAEAGRQAVAMLLRKIAAPAAALPARVLPLTLDPGDTCGPAPRGGPPTCRAHPAR